MPSTPTHRQTSLLGDDFWRDQVKSEDGSIEDGKDALQTFPFNLGLDMEQSTCSPAQGQGQPETKALLQKRRLSIVNDGNDNSNTPRPDTAPRNINDKETDSPMQPKLLQKAQTMLRSSLRMPTQQHPQSQQPDITTLLANIQRDMACTPQKPLLHFCGGAAWNILPRNIETIALDLFRPATDVHDQDNAVLDVRQMAPLGQFRNLRSLTITGMAVSYQLYIWQAVWLNPRLDELVLGSTLEPRILEPALNWPVIRSEWMMDRAVYKEPVYFGQLGDGNLHRSLGTAEYLDKHAIEKAKILAGVTDRTPRRLPIRKLTLFGFVVDADPFVQWFDPRRLRGVDFRDGCVDAGFWLPRAMRRVIVTFPQTNEQKPGVSVPVSRPDLNELKIVELQQGKKVGEVGYRGCEGLIWSRHRKSQGKNPQDEVESEHAVKRPRPRSRDTFPPTTAPVTPSKQTDGKGSPQRRTRERKKLRKRSVAGIASPGRQPVLVPSTPGGVRAGSPNANGAAYDGLGEEGFLRNLATMF